MTAQKLTRLSYL